MFHFYAEPRLEDLSEEDLTQGINTAFQRIQGVDAEVRTDTESSMLNERERAQKQEMLRKLRAKYTSELGSNGGIDGTLRKAINYINNELNKGKPNREDFIGNPEKRQYNASDPEEIKQLKSALRALLDNAPGSTFGSFLHEGSTKKLSFAGNFSGDGQGEENPREILALMWLAATDKNMEVDYSEKPANQSKTDYQRQCIEGETASFIGQLADIRRAHNDGQYKPVDAVQDDPSCGPGTLGRICNIPLYNLVTKPPEKQQEEEKKDLRTEIGNYVDDYILHVVGQLPLEEQIQLLSSYNMKRYMAGDYHPDQDNFMSIERLRKEILDKDRDYMSKFSDFLIEKGVFEPNIGSNHKNLAKYVLANHMLSYKKGTLSEENEGVKHTKLQRAIMKNLFDTVSKEVEQNLHVDPAISEKMTELKEIAEKLKGVKKQIAEINPKDSEKLSQLKEYGKQYDALMVEKNKRLREIEQASQRKLVETLEKKLAENPALSEKQAKDFAQRLFIKIYCDKPFSVELEKAKSLQQQISDKIKMLEEMKANYEEVEDKQELHKAFENLVQETKALQSELKQLAEGFANDQVQSKIKGYMGDLSIDDNILQQMTKEYTDEFAPYKAQANYDLEPLKLPKMEAEVKESQAFTLEDLKKNPQFGMRAQKQGERPAAVWAAKQKIMEQEPDIDVDVLQERAEQWAKENYDKPAVVEVPQPAFTLEDLKRNPEFAMRAQRQGERAAVVWTVKQKIMDQEPDIDVNVLQKRAEQWAKDNYDKPTVVEEKKAEKEEAPQVSTNEYPKMEQYIKWVQDYYYDWSKKGDGEKNEKTVSAQAFDKFIDKEKLQIPEKDKQHYLTQGEAHFWLLAGRKRVVHYIQLPELQRDQKQKSQFMQGLQYIDNAKKHGSKEANLDVIEFKINNIIKCPGYNIGDYLEKSPTTDIVAHSFANHIEAWPEHIAELQELLHSPSSDIRSRADICKKELIQHFYRTFTRNSKHAYGLENLKLAATLDAEYKPMLDFVTKARELNIETNFYKNPIELDLRSDDIRKGIGKDPQYLEKVKQFCKEFKEVPRVNLGDSISNIEGLITEEEYEELRKKVFQEESDFSGSTYDLESLQNEILQNPETLKNLIDQMKKFKGTNGSVDRMIARDFKLIASACFNEYRLKEEEEYLNIVRELGFALDLVLENEVFDHLDQRVRLRPEGLNTILYEMTELEDICRMEAGIVYDYINVEKKVKIQQKLSENLNNCDMPSLERLSSRLNEYRQIDYKDEKKLNMKLEEIKSEQESINAKLIELKSQVVNSLKDDSNFSFPQDEVLIDNILQNKVQTRLLTKEQQVFLKEIAKLNDQVLYLQRAKDNYLSDIEQAKTDFRESIDTFMTDIDQSMLALGEPPEDSIPYKQKEALKKAKGKLEQVKAQELNELDSFINAAQQTYAIAKDMEKEFKDVGYPNIIKQAINWFKKKLNDISDKFNFEIDPTLTQTQSKKIGQSHQQKQFEKDLTQAAKTRESKGTRKRTLLSALDILKEKQNEKEASKDLNLANKYIHAHLGDPTIFGIEMTEDLKRIFDHNAVAKIDDKSTDPIGITINNIKSGESLRITVPKDKIDSFVRIQKEAEAQETHGAKRRRKT